MHIKDTFPELYQLRRPLKPEEARARLRDKRGREFWQSLEELAATPEFEELVHREFPEQAAVLSLYDPDRSETIINRGEVRTYTAFLAEVATLLEAQRPKQGAGLRFL